MTQYQVLEFPAMFHGHTETVRRAVTAMGEEWAREYLKTGGFAQPQRMIQVPPGELLELQSGTQFDAMPVARWRLYMLISVFMSLNGGVPSEERRHMKEAFESFCLSTPWGALYYTVPPQSPRSAERMAQRLAALLRFWDVLQAPRYFFQPTGIDDSLEDLIHYIYRDLLNAWCPGGPPSVREHLALAVERMARATREECVEAVLQVIPNVVRANKDLQNREQLGDPVLQRERLAVLSSKDFADVSCASRFAVNSMLYDWDRALGRR